MKISVLNRLIKNRKIVNGCWEWQGYRNKGNYGVMSNIEYPTILVHKLSYLIFIGDVEHKMYVCHKCDNPCCYNPFHLFKGDQFDNMQDAVNKGRIPKSNHGTISAYRNYGCRCELCNKEKSRYDKVYRDKENIKKPSKVQHNGGKYSKYKGVTVSKRSNKFLSRIYANNKLIHIGTYDTDIEAALMYNKLAVKFKKEYAELNIIKP